MNGLLVRVGIDSTAGRWNAPVRKGCWEFAYVTIPEIERSREGMVRLYDEFSAVLDRFGERLPEALVGRPTHLDPDFKELTYGDRRQRGKRIHDVLTSGDLLVFFAALRPIDDKPRPLVYALVGLYVVEEIVCANSVREGRWGENAHTRRMPMPGDEDIVVRAKPGVSGRLRHCLPIGEWRNRAYRVGNDVLDAWGGLDIKDGYIHRSVWLPAFLDAAKFYDWFLARKPELVAENNPA